VAEPTVAPSTAPGAPFEFKIAAVGLRAGMKPDHLPELLAKLASDASRSVVKSSVWSPGDIYVNGKKSSGMNVSLEVAPKSDSAATTNALRNWVASANDWAPVLASNGFGGVALYEQAALFSGSGSSGGSGGGGSGGSNGSSSNGPKQGGSSESSGSVSMGAALGISTAVIVVLATLAVLSVCFLRRRRERAVLRAEHQAPWGSDNTGRLTQDDNLTGMTPSDTFGSVPSIGGHNNHAAYGSMDPEIGIDFYRASDASMRTTSTAHVVEPNGYGDIMETQTSINMLYNKFLPESQDSRGQMFDNPSHSFHRGAAGTSRNGTFDDSAPAAYPLSGGQIEVPSQTRYEDRPRY
jgi:hypothetical protein